MAVYTCIIKLGPVFLLERTFIIICLTVQSSLRAAIEQ